MSNKTPISHDKYGSKVYSDSIIHDEIMDEYFIPVEQRGVWGDYFLGDFYPLDPQNLKVAERHGTMKDLQKMMQEDTAGSVYNVKGDLNV